MKKIYILMVAIMVTSLSFAQGPIITMISDGDCSGGTPKVLEIYANGTVDFTMYSLENQTNANTTWSNALDLSPLGTVTDAFIYVFKDATGGIFTTEYASVTTGFLEDTGSTVNFNGDDRIRIIETATTTVVDQYGVEGVDGSGTNWEYKDGYAKRNNATNANAGAFNPANWTNSNGLLNGFGVCQAGATFESIIGLATFTAGTSTAPTLAIISPTDGGVLPPGDFTLTYSISNFNVATAGSGDGHFHYKIDGVDQGAQYVNTGSIDITGLAPGAHTVQMDLRDDAHQPLSPVVETPVINFTIQAYTQVADLAALRADVDTNDDGGFYELTGTPTVTYARTERNQKYIQDATAAILIDDQPGIITTNFSDGDGISGLKGQTYIYNGVLQFKPSQDAMVATGTTITPEVVTVLDLTTNHEMYESELVEIQGVTFADAGTAFATNTNYDFSDPDTMAFRSSFSEADYIGQNVPSGAVDIIVFVGEYNGTPQVVARTLADLTADVAENTIKGFAMYPNPTKNVLTITTAQNLDKNVQIFDILGKQVLNTVLTGSTLNVSNLNTGLYLIKVTEAKSTITRKLVIK